MEAEHRSLLRRNRMTFARDLILEELMQILVSKNILSDRMVEAILSKQTNFDRNVEFMNKLPTRGPKAFSAFCNALIDTDQKHLADILNPTSEMNVDSTCLLISGTAPSAFTFSESTPKKHSSPGFDVSAIKATAPKIQESPKFSYRESYPTTAAHKNTFSNVSKVSPISANEPECKSCAHLPVEHMEATTLHSSIGNSQNITVPPNFEELRSYTPMEELQKAAGLMQINGNHSTIKSSIRTNHTLESNTRPDALNYSDESFNVCDTPTWNSVQVRPCDIRFMRENMGHCYPMFKQCKGVALIINVLQFEPSACLDDRKGGEQDYSRLEIMFRQLSYDVFKLVNGTAYEIINTLKNFSLWAKLAEYESCFIVIMSHGEDGIIFGRDGTRVVLRDVYNFFSNENCLALQNKPKIFLVQACRGDDPDRGTDQIDTPNAKKDTSKSTKRHLDFSNSVTHARNKLPAMSDCLFAYATVPGFAAMRNTERGSWFIQAFIQVVAFHARNKSLLEILTMTNDNVKGREGNSPNSEFHRCKEMSEFTSTLCRSFFFFPGLYQES